VNVQVKRNRFLTDIEANDMSKDSTHGMLATLSDELAAAVEHAGKSVVAIHARRRIPASGVHWKAGVIVAAHHTLERDRDIRVTLPDGSSVAAQLAGRDPGTDLAVLRVTDANFATAPRIGADGIAVGRLVLALGRPWDGGVTASLGLISAVGGEFRTWHGGRIDRLVRLDIMIHDGFSGGPLVDASGNVLGINTSALARRGPVTVPAETVDRVVDQLLATGRIARGYLGVGLQPVRLPEALRKESGHDATIGLLIMHVESGGPAERAGLFLGDVLIAIGGQSVRDLRDVAALLGPDSVGSSVRIDVIRGGRKVTIDTVVAERPSGEEA
jgi:S1-C subfamily serine protease